jgi:hypothetical protein
MDVLSLFRRKALSQKEIVQETKIVVKETVQQDVFVRNVLALVKDAETQIIWAHRCSSSEEFKAYDLAHYAKAPDAAQRSLLNARMYGVKARILGERIEKDLLRVRQSEKDSKIDYFTSKEWEIIATAKRINVELLFLARKARDIVTLFSKYAALPEKEVYSRQKELTKQLAALLDRVKRLILLLEELLKLEQSTEQLLNEYLNAYGVPTEAERAAALKKAA